MIDNNELFIVTFKFGGHWSTVKKIGRKKYEGGKQRTVKINRDIFNYFVLVEEIEKLCPWLRGCAYSFYHHIYGTSPKEYKIIQNDSDVIEILKLFDRSCHIEIVIITEDGSNRDSVIELQSTLHDREDMMLLQCGEGTSNNPMIDYYDSSSNSDSPWDDKFGPDFNVQLSTHIADDNKNLAIGDHFDDALTFKQYLKTKAITENFGLKITASNKKRICATCSYLGCPWRVRASVCSDGQTFEVRKLEGLHSCPGINRAGNRHATSSWIASQIQNMVKKHPDIPPKHIKDDLENKYGLSLPYMKLWRSREIARDYIFGSVDESYKWLPALKAELIKGNPGSHITVEYDSIDNSFRRFFVSFKVCVDGFLVGCRPLVGLDACHLKSKYLGMLLAATSLDDNNGLYTIAFAVVETESKATWQWFLQHLLESFGVEVYPLAFMSDMEKGLGEAIKHVFPNAEHRVCIRHLWKNIKKSHRGYDSHKIHRIVWAAANAYTKDDYERNLNELLVINPQIHYYLLNLPYKWSRSQFMVEIKNHALTNNHAESFNAWIAQVRGKSVVDLIDSIRGMLMEQRAVRKINSMNWRGCLVPAAEDYIRGITTNKDHFIIRASTTYAAEVETQFDRFKINIEQRECSCKIWQLTGLPCLHAAAFISTKELPLWNIYVDEHYYVTRYVMAYDGAISPLPGKNHWDTTNIDVEISAPNTIRPRGRPRKRRLKSFMEGNKKKLHRVHKCSRCGCSGHHKNTCKSPLNPTQSQFPEVDADAYCSEVIYTEYGWRSKLPVRRGQTEDFNEGQI